MLASSMTTVIETVNAGRRGAYTILSERSLSIRFSLLLDQASKPGHRKPWPPDMDEPATISANKRQLVEPDLASGL